MSVRSVFVVVPRHVRASDAQSARDRLAQAGYACRLCPSPLDGYVLAEFDVAVRRDESVVVEAFEIEVDELLRECWVPSGAGFRLVRFGGTGARAEVR